MTQQIGRQRFNMQMPVLSDVLNTANMNRSLKFYGKKIVGKKISRIGIA